ncbi:HAD family hydrolase [Streptacidiphilus sp. N1-3]|uniref:HAD family hydrolase n=1 Tax=Streptacidiphilus alkalitolerans TaxID=3342712 RepID=A0ABV6X8E5_9ACTN
MGEPVNGPGLVLWDVDGTLLDPAGFGRDAMHTAFERLYGRPVTTQVAFAGRTDRAIVRDLLAQLGSGHTTADATSDATTDTTSDTTSAEFQDLAGAIAEEQRDDFLAGGGRVLPGAAEALAALAALPGLVQSVLTGNARRIGLVKLAAAGLTDRLDLDVAAFGDHHLVRADLVDVARNLATRKYGVAFPPEAVVLVGDTPLDVQAALARGATAVAVATGSFGEAELKAAGAHTVLPDLTDLPRFLAAVRPAPPRR